MTEQSGAALAERIAALSREEVLEACYALGLELEAPGVASAEPRDPAVTAFLEGVEAEPLRHLPEIEDLARLALTMAAAEPSSRSVVADVLDGVGRKTFTFNGDELVALALLGVILVQIIVTKGRTATKRSMTMRFGEDGRLDEVTVEEETRYGIQTPDVRQLGETLLGPGDGEEGAAEAG